MVEAFVRCALPSAFVFAVLLLVGSGNARPRHSRSAPELLDVITPGPGDTVPAHPDVNVVVQFARAAQGNVLADTGSLHAVLNGRNVTHSFAPPVDSGGQLGARAAIRRDELKIGQHRTNRLRVSVRARQAAATGQPTREIVRVRFHALEANDLPPMARIVVDSRVLRPGVPVAFDGSASSDPENDALTYHWDFGDGSEPSTDVAPTHTYTNDEQTRTAQLTVSDGQTSATAAVTLLACSKPDGSGPGTLRIVADGPLEFGAVALGASATRTFQAQNTSVDPNSRLAVCVAVDGSGFTVTPPRLDLGPQESGAITLTFAPQAPGHGAATIAMVTSADNRGVVSLLGHGYGGGAPGPGPTQASAPVFYSPLVTGLVEGFLPDGTPITPDSSVHTCVAPGTRSGSGDDCIVDADCAVAGEICQQSNNVLFYPADLCGDGAGGVYLLSNDGAVTDPSPSSTDAERSEVVMQLTLDAGGNTTSRALIYRTTSGTNYIACDRIPASAGGRVFLAEAHQLPDTGNCFRSDKESLVAVHKDGASPQTLLDRIDAAEGLSACNDDLDSTTHLEISPDGGPAFASFDSGGIWRLTPTPFDFLDQSYQESFFSLHPDGSVMYATIADGPTTAMVKVFKVSAAQVAGGPLAEPAVTPCGSFLLPDNPRAGGSPRGSTVAGLGAAPSVAGSQDGTVLVSVVTPSLADAGADNLTVRATVAFSSLAGSPVCTPLGVVNLQEMDQLRF